MSDNRGFVFLELIIIVVGVGLFSWAALWGYNNFFVEQNLESGVDISDVQGQLAFVREGEVWLINGNGTNERRITDYAENDFSLVEGIYPVWSNDGSFLNILTKPDDGETVFVALYDSSTSEIQYVDTAGMPLEIINAFVHDVWVDEEGSSREQLAEYKYVQSANLEDSGYGLHVNRKNGLIDLRSNVLVGHPAKQMQSSMINGEVVYVVLLEDVDETGDLLMSQPPYEEIPTKIAEEVGVFALEDALLLYELDSSIYKTYLNSGETVQIPISIGSSEITDLRISPNKEFFAVLVNVDESWPRTYRFFDLQGNPVYEDVLQRLLDEPSVVSIFEMTFSPDGYSGVVTVGGGDRNQEKLVYFDLRSGITQTLTGHMGSRADGSPVKPVWSPSGSP